MAENQEDRSREDLSEEASPYRIEEMRRKGSVAQSRELTGMLALLAAGATLYVCAPHAGEQMLELMRSVFRSDLSARGDLGSNHRLADALFAALKTGAWLALPACIAGFVFGVAGSFAQIGAIFSADPLTPDLSKIDPIQGLQRLLSARQAIDGVRLLFKSGVAVLVAYLIAKSDILKSPVLVWADPGALPAVVGHSAWVMFVALIAVLGVFAAFDYVLQRREYGKNVRLTKQEAKQEHKEREGDPQLKARIRSVQREMARRRMMQAVKKADVIITNPTHIAVAIVYEKDKMSAPKVVAKGADFLAQRIKQIAADAGVPMVENVPLARTLYKTVKVGQQIPHLLYQAVAEVLAYVYRLKNKGFR